jgi:hypothetical protein
MLISLYTSYLAVLFTDSDWFQRRAIHGLVRNVGKRRYDCVVDSTRSCCARIWESDGILDAVEKFVPLPH